MGVCLTYVQTEQWAAAAVATQVQPTPATPRDRWAKLGADSATYRTQTLAVNVRGQQARAPGSARRGRESARDRVGSERASPDALRDGLRDGLRDATGAGTVWLLRPSRLRRQRAHQSREHTSGAANATYRSALGNG